MVLRGVQPVPDLRKGRIPRNFTQVEFYVSRGFLKFFSIFFLSHAQEKLQKCASECAVTRSRHRRPSQVLRLFPTGCKIRFHAFFFLSFATADKNLRKVRFTQVEYYAGLGVNIFGPLRGRT